MVVVTGVGNSTSSFLALGMRLGSATFGGSPTCVTRMEEVLLYALLFHKTYSINNRMAIISSVKIQTAVLQFPTFSPFFLISVLIPFRMS